MISLSSSANAQFIGINVDYGIGYSAAPGKVSGGSVGISHPAPFIPNIGYSSVSFIDKETITDSSDNTVSLETTTTIETINLFYNVPFPVVTITVGFGYGADNLYTGVETITTIDQVESNLETSVSEAFFHIGLPFWNTVEFHLGYHFMSFNSIDITSKSTKIRGTYTNDNKKNYSGGMTTIGVQVAF
ncbi:MAG TPA: hypothetical protein EYO46_04455 [Candidatus Lambdaproteobacteria bacterium]|nr:hypothetical protein [Candidatus Lambdaproteobacteria bacterium]